MAYDEPLAARIRGALPQEKNIEYCTLNPIAQLVIIKGPKVVFRLLT